MLRFVACFSLLAWTASLGACGDEVRGELKVLIVPLHEGRNQVQDPFALVSQVELGLTEASGEYQSLGGFVPLARFGPGLVGNRGTGIPTLTGRNERGRPVSLGYGREIELAAGIDALISIPFARVDWAVARRMRPEDLALPDPLAGRPPALRLDQANLEQGSVDSDGDSGCLVWLHWTDDGLLFFARVFDDTVQPAGLDQAILDGDGLTVFIDGLADGLGGGADDLVLNVAADGRVEPEDAVQGLTVESVAGGYQISFSMPLPAVAKNRAIGFDVRQTDFDGQAGATYLTWVFDPRNEGQAPSAEQYGRLVYGVPVLDLISQNSSVEHFSKPDGLVELSGGWTAGELQLTVDVTDDHVVPAGTGDGLSGADRVEVWLDLANGMAPAPEPDRFCRIVASAGGSSEFALGPDPANVTASGKVFTGSIKATSQSGGYSIQLAIPWSDLQLVNPVQRGWFLGLEILVIDEDDGSSESFSWSAGVDNPDVWSEIRLFSVE